MSNKKIKHLSGDHIVVCDRGWVYVGDITVDADYCRIKDAYNIRRWGTTRGLGELVSGPTATTVLDPVGNVIIPARAVLHYIPCLRSRSN